MSLLNVIILVLFVAQFTPQGQQFLATRRGAAATVVIGGLAILSLIPSVLLGNVLSMLFCGLWGYIAYPRLNEARSFFKDAIKYRKLPR